MGVNIPVEALRRTILSKDTNNFKKTENLLTDLIRGFIPKYLTNKLEKKIKGNNNKRNIMRIIINGLQEGFYQYNIWKSKCKRWQLWQDLEKINIKKSNPK